MLANSHTQPQSAIFGLGLPKASVLLHPTAQLARDLTQPLPAGFFFCRAGLVWYLLQPSERTACSNTVYLPPIGPGSNLAGTRQQSAAIGFACGAFRRRSSDIGFAQQAQNPPITVEIRYMVGGTSSPDQRHLEKSSINTVCYEHFLVLAQVLLRMPDDQHAIECWAYRSVWFCLISALISTCNEMKTGLVIFSSCMNQEVP